MIQLEVDPGSGSRDDQETIKDHSIDRSRIRVKRASRTTIEGSGIGILVKVDPDQEWETRSRSKSRVGDKSRDQRCARDRGA